MPRYEACDESVRSIVAQMLERYHQPLRDAEVRIDVLKAFALTDENGDSIGCAIKHQGYQAAGVVRIINLKDRTKGLGDAEIVIDGDRWDEWSEDEKAALIDHEIEHLELRYDNDGLLVRDDLGRPKLRLRKHDHQFGWFDSIARRHGSASFEMQQYEQFRETHRQMWLPFADDEVIPQSGGRMPGENTEAQDSADIEEAVAGSIEQGTVTREQILAGGVTSVTLSAGDKSVTLTPAKLKKAAKAMRGAARHTRSAAATK